MHSVNSEHTVPVRYGVPVNSGIQDVHMGLDGMNLLRVTLTLAPLGALSAQLLT